MSACIDNTLLCIDNTLMQKISLTIRVSATELETWKQKAGDNLSAWIRNRCNGKEGDTADATGDRGVRVVARSADPVERTAPVDLCSHGASAGKCVYSMCRNYGRKIGKD